MFRKNIFLVNFRWISARRDAQGELLEKATFDRSSRSLVLLMTRRYFMDHCSFIGENNSKKTYIDRQSSLEREEEKRRRRKKKERLKWDKETTSQKMRVMSLSYRLRWETRTYLSFCHNCSLFILVILLLFRPISPLLIVASFWVTDHFVSFCPWFVDVSIWWLW